MLPLETLSGLYTKAVNDELERIWQEQSWSALRYRSRICMERLLNATKHNPLKPSGKYMYHVL
jgi:hypothetical protein